MKINYSTTLLKPAVLAAVFAVATSLHAVTTVTSHTSTGTFAAQSDFTSIAFSDSAEAGMMHRAYRILATGDHDYDGHRIKAMHEIEAAAKLLGLDLSGDARDHEKQFLSDDKMREAKGLLEKVLNASEVKDQKHISKHIEGAIKQIKGGLHIR